MTATTVQRDHTAHSDPLGQARIQITLEDDVVTWRHVCCCGQPLGHAVPASPEVLSMLNGLTVRARRNALTTVTLAVTDFKEVSR